ncbi:MAG: phosphoribosylformylglycinamidine cyclo-ligase [Actinomycetota bacterium]
MSTPSYESAGVRGQTDALSAVERHLRPTFSFPANGEVLTDFGHYASVIKLSSELALALCTDGVGSKSIVASAMNRYDTIAFDCVAMNVNDLLCVGARPLAMVDYLGVHTLDSKRTDELLGGLSAAAKEAGIAVPGGEMAQLPEVIGSDGRVPGDPTAFDLVGTCVGTLRPDDLILGRAIAPGDALIGLASSGLHSNGYTLARRVLLEDSGMRLDEHVEPLGRTLGEELLEPTEIYVRAVTALWDAGVETRGLAHITGEGFSNLVRLEAPVGYELDQMPEPPPIFDLIRERGDIEHAEMFRVFNMGVGMVIVTPASHERRALAALENAGQSAQRIGTVSDEVGIVRLKQHDLELAVPPAG